MGIFKKKSQHKPEEYIRHNKKSSGHIDMTEGNIQLGYIIDEGTRNMQMGDDVRALDCGQRVLEISPFNPAGWYIKGSSEEKLHAFQEAAFSYKMFLKVATNELGTFKKYSEEHLKSLILDRASEVNAESKIVSTIVLCDHILWDLDPSDVMTLYLKGICFSQLGAVELAINSYEQALQNCCSLPREMEAQIRVSITKLVADNKTKLEKGRAMLEEQRNAPDDLIKTAIMLDLQGMHGVAAMYARNAVEVDPQTGGLMILGNVLMKLNQVHEAIEIFDRVIEMNPEEAEAYEKKVTCLKRIERFYELVECCEDGIRQDSNQFSFYMNKAEAEIQLDRYDEAIKTLQGAAEVVTGKNDIDSSSRDLALVIKDGLEKGFGPYKKIDDLKNSFNRDWSSFELPKI